MIELLELDLTKAKKEIRKIKAKRILLQLPDGLKDKTTEIIKELNSTGAEVIALMDPCFGACDANPQLLKEFNADLLIHLGHLQIQENKKILFIPLKYGIEKGKIKKLSELLEKELNKKKINSIALCTTAQYLDWVPELKKELKKIKVFTSKGTGRIKAEAQVLGCNFSALKEPSKKAEAIVFLGDGLFHPLGASYANELPFYALNPIEEKIKEISSEKEKFLRKSFARIAKAEEAESFGIVISKKQGQKFLNKAIKLKKLIEGKGKKAFLFAVDYVNESYFLGTKIDCFVITACPRIVFDDA
ncbi:MAG: diphthamide biosynthesis enzyme Dph2, partial [Candidatus Diapherotrites archaeon]